MIWIALDQSSKVVGYAVMNESELLEYGVYKVPQSKDIMGRVFHIIKFLKDLMKKYEVYKITVGLEDTQESRLNTNTFQLLTRVLGALEYFLFSEDVPYSICHISSWRSHSGIKGKNRQEKKENAIKTVKEKYGFIDIAEDAAEAILICEYLRSQEKAW